MHGWEHAQTNSPHADPFAKVSPCSSTTEARALASLDRHAKGTRRAQVADHVHATPSLTHNSPQGGPEELLVVEISAWPPGQVYTTPQTFLAVGRSQQTPGRDT